MLELRDYQKECIQSVLEAGEGKYLVCMATGLGKTVVFTSIPNNYGKTLVLAHRQELIFQPKKYYHCPVGIEMAGFKSNGEDVVIASVQSLVRRLNNFNPNHFGRIIVDEAHHIISSSYKRIIEHFSGAKQVIGVTATPKRGDKVGLEQVFERIIFERGLLWAIQQGYLCDIECISCTIQYSLQGVRSRCGDYAQDELEEAMSGTAQEIARVYKEHAKGQTIIFATSVQHAHEIAEAIGEEAVAIDANTKNREVILASPPRCIVNCMVLTEGFDMPSIQTVIMARPTQNVSLYTQCVGRGTRLYSGKDKLLLIDCVGVSALNMCTAPSLIGLALDAVPENKRSEVKSDSLLDLEDIVQEYSDSFDSWKINAKIVDIWAHKNRYDTRDINFFRFANGDLRVLNYTIKGQDQFGMSEGVPMQRRIDELFIKLRDEHESERYIWDKTVVKRWAKMEASDAQMKHINKRFGDVGVLTKLEASNILTRMWAKK